MGTLEAKISGERLDIEFFDKKLVSHMYLCEKITSSIDDELSARKLDPSGLVIILPSQLVATPLQIVQGLLHYVVYAGRLEKIKNRELLIALLTIGVRQLNQAVKMLEDSYIESSTYYMVCIDGDKAPCLSDKCKPVDIESFSLRDARRTLAKNIENVLSLA